MYSVAAALGTSAPRLHRQRQTMGSSHETGCPSLARGRKTIHTSPADRHRISCFLKRPRRSLVTCYSTAGPLPRRLGLLSALHHLFCHRLSLSDLFRTALRCLSALGLAYSPLFAPDAPRFPGIRDDPSNIRPRRPTRRRRPRRLH
jgi:hypothetical protein